MYYFNLPHQYIHCYPLQRFTHQFQTEFIPISSKTFLLRILPKALFVSRFLWLHFKLHFAHRDEIGIHLDNICTLEHMFQAILVHLHLCDCMHLINSTFYVADWWLYLTKRIWLRYGDILSLRNGDILSLNFWRHTFTINTA